MEKVIETKICGHCQIKFNIIENDIEFYDKLSPTFSTPGSTPGWKLSIPSPTLCPDCRQQRRLSFRNERNLYKRKCDLTGKDIISIYSPDKPYKVYEQGEWWSDKWSALDYGRDFDFEKGFFEQFEKLHIEVPKISLLIVNSENSEFNNDLHSSKKSYLSFDSSYIEDSSYISASKNISNSTDIWWCESIQESHEIISSDNIYNCSFCYWCYYLKNCMLCKECYNCEDCIICYGLKNKKYCIENRQYTQEEFLILKKRYYQGDYSLLSEAKNIFQNLCLKYPARHIYTYNSNKCDGNNIYNSNCCYKCFDVASLDNGNYSYDSGSIKNIFDCSYTYEGEGMILDSISSLNCMKILFSNSPTDSKSSIYCSYIIGCSDCFGCIGLRNAQYCILNKQYTKEEYEILVPKIIEYMISTGEWGEFFPSSISPFGYNETVAMEYFPIAPPVLRTPPSAEGENSHASESRGRFKWSDYENPIPLVSKTIPANKLPDNIKDIPDDIINWAIICEISGKPFRIIRSELEFYRKHSVPVPKRHPDQRHLDRMNLRNPRKLYDRNCDKCGIEIKTTYTSKRSEIIYCEDCYNK